jgi:hypothetical protein
MSLSVIVLIDAKRRGKPVDVVACVFPIVYRGRYIFRIPDRNPMILIVPNGFLSGTPKRFRGI